MKSFNKRCANIRATREGNERLQKFSVEFIAYNQLDVEKTVEITQLQTQLKEALAHAKAGDELAEYYGDKKNWKGNTMCGSGDYSRSYFKLKDQGDISYIDNFEEHFTIKGKRARAHIEKWALDKGEK